jgi:hypothetical protein
MTIDCLSRSSGFCKIGLENDVTSRGGASSNVGSACIGEAGLADC